MKTAIQIAIESYKNDGVSFTDWFIKNYEMLLEKEKEHIMDFFLKGYSIGESDLNPKVEFEKYYNQTYNQKQHIIDIMKADEDDGLYNQNK